MRKRTLRTCVDCGKQFMGYGDRQIRCPECQAVHRRKLDRERKHMRSGPSRVPRTRSMVIDGHVQVCRYIGECFYGQHGENGCAYALEEKKTRRSQGLWIRDGKCPAFRPKRKGERLNRTMHYGDTI